MRILVDTNFFIYREDNHVLTPSLQKLLRRLNKLQYEILIHPKSIVEIEKDLDEKRKKIALSKISTYSQLESPPSPQNGSDFLKVVGQPSNPHDIIDNLLLFAVYKKAVGFLISEDKGIQKKARTLKIRDRVLSINDALETFDEIFTDDQIGHPLALKEDMIYNQDLSDHFFDSLKLDYPEFEKWFEKISKDGGKCWVYHRENNSIGALLIYKIEDESVDCNYPLPKKKRLKIRTLMVEHTGHRLGELFIKMVVDFSIKNNLSEIYLTHFSKIDDELVNLISQYGFFLIGQNARGEDVFIKEIHPSRTKIGSYLPHEISKMFWPNFYDGRKVKKYLVPILPKYHNRLFTESINRQTLLPEFFGQFIVEGNTISKAYLSRSRISTISPGDLLIFYRAEDIKGITTLGVVEEVYSGVQDKQTIIRLIRKRTVYTDREISRFLGKQILVIRFNWHFHLPLPIKLEKLKKIKALTVAPQSISMITHERYIRIKNEGDIDGRFIVN